MSALTEVQKSEIIEAVKAYATAKGMVHDKTGNINQTQIARYVGVSGSYMSHILRGKWNEIPAGKELVQLADTYFLKMAEKVGYQLTTENWKHFDSDNYISIVNDLNDARARGQNKVIDGATGSGKSYAIKRYQRERPNGTIVVTCDSFMTNTDFGRALNEAVGGIPSRTMYVLVRNIEEQLTVMYDKGYNPIIIIDEAENLKDSSYGAVKAIIDRVVGKVPVVLVGANNYIQKIRNKAIRQHSCFPQVWSRFKGGQSDLFKLNSEELKQVCASLGIKDKAVIDYLLKITDNWRDLSDHIKALMAEHHETGRPIDLIMAQTIFK